jgi:putative alpha-1,2-mannosidase
MDLSESGVQVEATSDSRAGILRFNLQHLRPAENSSSFYLLVMSFDTLYNESTVTAVSDQEMFLSNPVHRFYQGSGESAGFSGHHTIHFAQPAKTFGIIEGYSSVTYSSGGGSVEGSSDSRGSVVMFYEFDREEYDEVEVAVGSSFVSRAKATANLHAELGEGGARFELERVRERTTTRWESALSRVLVADDAEVGWGAMCLDCSVCVCLALHCIAKETKS